MDLRSALLLPQDLISPGKRCGWEHRQHLGDCWALIHAITGHQYQ
jgi:hypothetical protein